MNSINLLLNTLPETKDLSNIDAHLIHLGIKLQAKFKICKTNRCNIESNTITFTLKDFSIKNFNKFFNSWHKRTAKKIFEQSVEFWHKEMQEFGYNVPLPVIKIERMQNEWGLCYYTKKEIVFNEYLTSAPQECLHYIVQHEMVHLLEENHNNLFDSLMTILEPQWHVKSNQLKIFTARHQIIPTSPKN